MRSRRLRTDYPQILISHKADMEARDVLDRTPLMSAAIAGQVDVVRFFFDQGKRIRTSNHHRHGRVFFILSAASQK